MNALSPAEASRLLQTLPSHAAAIQRRALGLLDLWVGLVVVPLFAMVFFWWQRRTHEVEWSVVVAAAGLLVASFLLLQRQTKEYQEWMRRAHALWQAGGRPPSSWAAATVLVSLAVLAPAQIVGDALDLNGAGLGLAVYALVQLALWVLLPTAAARLGRPVPPGLRTDHDDRALMAYSCSAMILAGLLLALVPPHPATLAGVLIFWCGTMAVRGFVRVTRG